MALLSNPMLQITISTSSQADVDAKVDVSLSVFEQFLVNNAGLRLSLRCQLWGEDGFFNGSDDLQFIFPLQTVSGNNTFTFAQRLSRSILDEDLGGDEIYAKFHLFSREQAFPLDVQTRSGTVSGQF